ncbi:hypothetical protein MAR_013955, partial [Mya arenaria]
MDYKTNTVDIHTTMFMTRSTGGPEANVVRVNAGRGLPVLTNTVSPARSFYVTTVVRLIKYTNQVTTTYDSQAKQKRLLFCKDHDELCCEIYALAHHRKCDNLHEIAKVVEDYNLDDGNLTQEVISAINKATTYIEKSTHALTKTKTQMSEICQQIDACKDKAMRAFDRSKEQVIKDMTETIEKEKTRQESRQLAANEARDSIDTTKSIFQAVNKDGSVTERFIVKQVLQKRLQEAKATFATLYLIDYSVDSNLHWKDNNIHQLFTCTDDICYVGVKRDNKSTNDLLIRKKCISAPVQFELMQTVNLVKTGNDKKEPLITGLDFLPEEESSHWMTITNDCEFVVSTLNDPRLARMIDREGKESNFNN